jgi:hypothetical protein
MQNSLKQPNCVFNLFISISAFYPLRNTANTVLGPANDLYTEENLSCVYMISDIVDKE